MYNFFPFVFHKDMAGVSQNYFKNRFRKGHRMVHRSQNTGIHTNIGLRMLLYALIKKKKITKLKMNLYQ